jgi:hypothetical protein
MIQEVLLDSVPQEREDLSEITTKQAINDPGGNIGFCPSGMGGLV